MKMRIFLGVLTNKLMCIFEIIITTKFMFEALKDTQFRKILMEYKSFCMFNLNTRALFFLLAAGVTSRIMHLEKLNVIGSKEAKYQGYYRREKYEQF